MSPPLPLLSHLLKYPCHSSQLSHALMSPPLPLLSPVLISPPFPLLSPVLMCKYLMISILWCKCLLISYVQCQVVSAFDFIIFSTCKYCHVQNTDCIKIIQWNFDCLNVVYGSPQLSELGRGHFYNEYHYNLQDDLFKYIVAILTLFKIFTCFFT